MPRVWAWQSEFRKAVADDYSPKTLDEFMTQWKAMNGRQKTWGVWRGEELGGLITFEPWNPVTGIAHCLFKKAFWGNETTIPAIRSAVAEMFADGTEKVGALVFAHNTPMMAAIKKLGAVREGTLRGQSRQDGKPVDVVAMAIFKEAFE